jgi:proteasome lid subunit RPN8/RPN11
MAHDDPLVEVAIIAAPLKIASLPRTGIRAMIPLVWARSTAIVTTVLLAQFVAAAASARECPPIILGNAHATLDEAAVGALHTLLRDGAQYESGGFIVEKNGAFRASKAVTQRSRTAVRYCIAVPRGATLAGLYHTHVARPTFSPTDRRNADRAGVPSYIGTIRDGAVFIYDPHRRKAQALSARVGSDAAPVRAAANIDLHPWSERLAASIRWAFDVVRSPWQER